MFMQIRSERRVEQLYLRPGAAETVDPGRRKQRLSGIAIE
jgi:hypothetical protein